MLTKIHIIKDDTLSRRSLGKLLKLNGFDPRESTSGKSGVPAVTKNIPDLVILDLAMPGMNGKEACKALKSEVKTAGVPILILTEEDKAGQDVALLDLGADDYLTKPIKTELLLARCRALLKKVQGPSSAPLDEITLGDLHLDVSRKTATLKGKKTKHLTPKEFEILYDLAVNHPKPRDRKTLYLKVWGIAPPSESRLKTVDVHIRRIRLKMKLGNGKWLLTLPGQGYSLTPPDPVKRPTS